MVDRIVIPHPRSVGKSTDHCPHTEDGLPAGYPMFRCAWPRCPKGVDGEKWVIQYGPYQGPLNKAEFKRVSFKVLGPGDKIAWRWEKIE